MHYSRILLSFIAPLLLAALPASAQYPPEEELPTVRLTAAFLSSGANLPEFFSRGKDGEFIPFTIGSNRFGPTKDVVDEDGSIILYREQEVTNPETGELQIVKMPAIEERLPEDAESVLLVFYFNEKNEMRKRVIAESADGPQPRTMRLINLFDRKVGVEINSDSLGSHTFLLPPNGDKRVDLDFKGGESFYYRYVIDLPRGDRPRRAPSWKSLSLLDRQRLLIFFANLRMVSEEYDDETGDVIDTEVFFKPTDIRVLELLP